MNLTIISDCSSDSEKGFNSVAHATGLMTCEDLGFVKCSLQVRVISDDIAYLA